MFIIINDMKSTFVLSVGSIQRLLWPNFLGGLWKIRYNLVNLEYISHYPQDNNGLLD